MKVTELNLQLNDERLVMGRQNVVGSLMGVWTSFSARKGRYVETWVRGKI